MGPVAAPGDPGPGLVEMRHRRGGHLLTDGLHGRGGRGGGLGGHVRDRADSDRRAQQVPEQLAGAPASAGNAAVVAVPQPHTRCCA